MEISVKSLGAKGDGSTLDTIAFQEAIKTVSASGGGKVVVEAGCYRLGTIKFYSNVELHLTEGAKLMASDNLSDFNLGDAEKIVLVDKPTWNACDYDGKPTKFFLYAYQCENISITGEGEIDGNEEIFYGNITKWHIDGFFYPRMPMIFFEDCEGICIEDVKLAKSAFWTTHLVGCKHILIQNITIDNNLKLANCDGIDPDHCQDMIIRNCKISAADDCIVFKATEASKKYGPCENIIVEDCTLISTSAAIKFGTESVSDFQNIHIRNCSILKSNRGICLQLRDGGNIRNVTFENISIETRRFSPIYWWGKAEPIIITAVRRNEQSKVGKIENISFKSIQSNSENGIFIYGTNHNINNITFDSISLNLNKKTDWEHNTYDLRPSEIGILEGNTYPLYLYSCKNIELKGFSYAIDSLLQDSMKNSFFIKDSSNITINGKKSMK